MIKFKTFLNEDTLIENFYLNFLFEEKETGTGQAADTKGKLHEILVGYHLLGGKHMSKHVDEEGDSPKQAHDKLKEKVSQEEYNKINNRAKAAASDLKQKYFNKDKIEDVHWTSKPGDIKRTTGIDSSQKDDQSDIIVNTKDKTSGIKHHGVSLKVSDGTSRHVPVSNAGKSALHPEFEKDKVEHHKQMLKSFPGLAKTTNAQQRKEYKRETPEREKQMAAMNLAYLHEVNAKTYKHIASLGQHELIDHVKKHVLQCNPTPMQKEGHNHIRHTTYIGGKKEGSNFKFDSHTPSEHYHNYFDGSHKIEPELKGTQIHFNAINNHTGEKKRIASQRVKLTSGSDPLSSMKVSGIAAD